MFLKLRIIDLSHNGFSGDLLPEFLQKWNAMKIVHKEELVYMEAVPTFQVITPAGGSTLWTLSISYTCSITIANKGTQRLYEKIQNAFVAFDLSNNKLRGEIPEYLGSLVGLQGLNLSHNKLTGVIPSSLANLTELESLDLFWNLLSGEIPQQLSELTFLQILNVSHNNLEGAIPRGKQFESFDNSSFIENPRLCGQPLSDLCGVSKALSPPLLSFQGDHDSKFPSGVDWIVIGLGYGSGILVGLVLGHALTTRYHEWFVRTFARGKRAQYRGQRKQQ